MKKIDFISQIRDNRQLVIEIADDITVIEQGIIQDTEFITTSELFLRWCDNI